jgi:hypothetical protein
LIGRTWKRSNVCSEPVLMVEIRAHGECLGIKCR